MFGVQMTAQDLLTQALRVVILLFCVSAMLNAGLGLTVKQILEPFHNVRLAASSFAASYVLTPFLAVAVAWMLSLAEPLRIGLILVSLTAGAEAGPKVAEMARGNVAFSIGLLAAQLVLTIVYIPVVFSVFLPEAHIQFGTLLLKLVVVVLLPLAVGLLLNARHSGMAERLRPWMHKASTAFMVLMAVLIVIRDSRAMLQLVGTRAIGAGALFAVLSFAGGYMLGGPGQENRRTLAIMSCGRNASISLMIASQVFGEPNVLLMITLTVFVMLSFLLPTAYWLGRRAGPQPQAV